jgi:hypothetical protein
MTRKPEPGTVWVKIPECFNDTIFKIAFVFPIASGTPGDYMEFNFNT